MIEDIQQQSQCVELKNGQGKKIHRSGPFNSTKSYTVKRELDGTYSIPLALHFEAGLSYDGKIPKDQVPSRYMEKVQQCIAKANTNCWDPMEKS